MPEHPVPTPFVQPAPCNCAACVEERVHVFGGTHAHGHNKRQRPAWQEEIATILRHANRQTAFGPIVAAVEKHLSEHPTLMIKDRTIRPSVVDFATRMEATLKRHDATKGDQFNWRLAGHSVLLLRLKIEIAELDLAIADGTPDEAATEAVDVANFAMMIADCLWPLAEDNAPRPS